MKRVYIFLLFILSGCAASQLPEPTRNLVITYDFDSRSLNVPEEGYRIRYGGTPRIVVENLNTSQYDVEVDEEQLVIAYQESVEGEEATTERNPAGLGEGVRVVPEEQKLRDTTELLSRSRALLARLYGYNNTNIDFLKSSYQSLVNSKNMPYREVKAAEAELDSLYRPLRDAVLAGFMEINRDYRYLVSQLLDMAPENETAAALSQSLETAYEAFQETDWMSSIAAIDQLKRQLSKNHFRATYNAPVVQADEVRYLLTIEERVPAGAAQGQVTVPIYVRVAGNWKVDVSSGVMFNLGLTDKSYRLDPYGEDSLLLEKNKSRSFFSPTVGILTHVYRKRADYTNWGISFGLGINDEQRLRYYGGLGLMLGESQRFVISGGVTAAPRALLQGSYEEGQRFAVGAAPESLTEEAYRIGAFLSLTYNLTSSTVKATRATLVIDGCIIKI